MNRQGPSRQASANSVWDEKLKTPKDAWPETPPDQYIAQVNVHDPVEMQFDHLLVVSAWWNLSAAADVD